MKPPKRTDGKNTGWLQIFLQGGARRVRALKCIAYVYILQSLKDNHNYIGSTTDIKRRVKEHQKGLVKSTKNRLPLILYGFRKFDSIKEAAIWEKKYKRSHGQLLRDIKRGLMAISKGT